MVKWGEKEEVKKGKTDRNKGRLENIYEGCYSGRRIWNKDQ